ncbi:MAG: hypothetical protein WBC04_19495 [Candidatus Acidiferrales bacterium]
MCKQRGLLPAELSLTPCLLQLAIACGMDLGLSPGEHIVRRHIADGAVKTYSIVVIHVGLNQASRIFPGQWCKGPNAL